MKLKFIVLMCVVAALFVFVSATKDDVVTIHTIGDSTMANKPLDKGNQERGWGQVLGEFFNPDKVVVKNYAVNGRSSKSFINEGRWDEVLKNIKPGDYVFIQFGHNDEKPKEDRHTDPGTTFDANLRKFAVEAKEKGAIPVLFNSIVRRNFGHNKNAVANDDYRKAKADDIVEGDTLIDTHGAYLDSPRNVAKELGIVFIDHNKLTHDLVQSLGREGSKKVYMWIEPNTCEACPNGRQDNTHLNVWGAHKVANLAVQEIVKKIPALKKAVNKKVCKQYNK